VGHDAHATTRGVVRGFVENVRSGRRPDDATLYLAAAVECHQLESEQLLTITRSPADYAAHVRDLVGRWGAYTLHIDELIVDGDRAHVRWTQRGHDLHGPDPTRAVIQITSATYRVNEGRIAEYWVQVDRLGVQAQTDRVAPPDGLPRYRLLTGPDDVSFCRRVSDALDLGFVLHGSPAATYDGEHVVAAQAVVWPTG